MNIIQSSSTNVLVHSLGDFDITYNNESLLTGLNRSNKLIDLLKYFLSNVDKKLFPENIIEDLWPEDNYDDPQNVFKAQIFRLRKALNDIVNPSTGEKCFEVNFKNGCYIFSASQSCIIDRELFEKAFKESEAISFHEEDKLIGLYTYAVKLYSGDYLKDSGESLWVIPIRNYLKRIYQKMLTSLLDILKRKMMYDQILDICEYAMVADPALESTHISFINALYELNRNKEALDHYSYITTKIYNEFGVKPSFEMISLYSKIQNSLEKKNYINTKISIDNLDDKGALLCSRDVFGFLYEIEKRRNSRNKTPSAEGILFIKPLDFGHIYKKDAAEIISPVVVDFLRKGDVVAVLNESQIAFILCNINPQEYDVVTKRMQEAFKKIPDLNAFNIEISLKPI